MPFRHWLPKTDPHAVIIALHGFNDYSRFFNNRATISADRASPVSITTTRFGAAPELGLWAGGVAYTDDLHTFVRLVNNATRTVRYLLGESMGGAIIITAMSQAGKSGVEGIILVAPALWARTTMPWYQTGLLWTLSHSFPWLTLTGEGVGVMPSDNIEMLRALGRDPWQSRRRGLKPSTDWLI